MTTMPSQSWLYGMVIPLALVIVAAVAVPLGLARVLPPTLPAVAINLALSAVLLYIFGAAALVLSRIASTPGIDRIIADDPAGALRWAVGLGALPVILWLPILGFVGLGLAQKAASR